MPSGNRVGQWSCVCAGPDCACVKVYGGNCDNLHVMSRLNRFTSLFGRIVVAAGIAAGLSTFLDGLGAQAAPAKPIFENGQAQVVPAFEDSSQWIKHHLWVETEFDSDGDRKHDRVHVDVVRQKQTETEGLKVPVVYESSPYFAGTSGDREFLWDVKQEVGAEPPPRQSQKQIDFAPNRT